METAKGLSIHSLTAGAYAERPSEHGTQYTNGRVPNPSFLLAAISKPAIVMREDNTPRHWDINNPKPICRKLLFDAVGQRHVDQPAAKHFASEHPPLNNESNRENPWLSELPVTRRVTSTNSGVTLAWKAPMVSSSLHTPFPIVLH